jgi:hypothetical protein
VSTSLDAPVYDKDGIRITSTSMTVRTREFPLEGVVSAHLSTHRAETGGLRVRAILGAGVAAAGVATWLSGSQVGAFAAVFGAFVVLFTVHRLRTRKAIYRLRLETDRGDVQVAADTDEAEMKAVLAAVREVVADRRGSAIRE